MADGTLIEKRAGAHGVPHDTTDATTKNILRRLRNIEGQARGLQRMVEEDQYCVDILTQISAKVTYYLAPNLQYFNLKDFWDVPHIAGSWIFSSFIYGIVYSAFCLALSLWLLKYKEF